MNATDQVKNFFGFSRIPFSKGIPVKELFLSASLKEAVTRLEIGVDNEEAGLITGESGIGKTNIIRHFTDQLDTQQYRPVYISAGNAKIGELAKRALTGLNVPAPFQSMSALRKLKDTVMDFHASKNIKVILIIDEAQELSPETILGLKTFLNYQMDNANLLFLLLCGHKTILETLKIIPLESFTRRIRINYEIEPLTLEETVTYIQHQLKNVGVTKNFFSEDAMASIFQISRGLMSMINKICFESIIYAVAHSKEIIEKSIVERFGA